MSRLARENCVVSQWQDDVRKIYSHHEKVDVVFHLAAVTSRDKFIKNPSEALDVNVCGTLSVLNFCKQNDARCVLLSSSGVYGAHDDLTPITEDSVLEPVGSYTTSKWLSERLCQEQEKQLGVNSVVLRLFNVYGYGQPSTFIVPYIVDCLIHKKKIFLRMPEAIRDFVYVDDVIEVMIKAAAYSKNGYHVFNVGSGEGTKIIDFIHIAENIFGSAVDIIVGQPHEGELRMSIADISKAGEELHWKPKYSIISGLDKIKKLSVQQKAK